MFKPARIKWTNERISSYSWNSSSAWEARHIAEAMKLVRDDCIRELTPHYMPEEVLKALTQVVMFGEANQRLPDEDKEQYKQSAELVASWINWRKEEQSGG